jgi:hypothetical protein
VTLSDSIGAVPGDGAGQEVLLLGPVAGIDALFAASVEAAGTGPGRKAFGLQQHLKLDAAPMNRGPSNSDSI